MSRSILIVGCDTGLRGDYYAEYVTFFKEATQSDDVYCTDIEELYIQCGDGNLTILDTRNEMRALADYDVVVWRGAGLNARVDVLKALSCYCDEHDVEFINDIPRGHHQSKLAQAVFCHANKLPMPATIYVNRAVLASSAGLNLEFPMILKAVNGAHGNDNHLVNSLESVAQITSTSTKRYVLQRLIPNEGDYRVLIVGDDVLVIERRAVDGSHLNNTSQGGSATITDPTTLPSGLIDDAKKFAGNLGMKIAGVDVMIDASSGTYYFLEVNSQPQLMTGAFVDEKRAMVRRLLDGIAKK